MSARSLRPRKCEEVRAENLLRRLGFSEIIHEPNRPGTWPDFSLPPDTSVEVRRLNQLYRRRGKLGTEFEHCHVSLERKILAWLAKFGPAKERSWFVDVGITEELEVEELKLVRRRLMQLLAGVNEDACVELSDQLSPHCTVWVLPASQPLPEGRFVLNERPDLNGTGFVLSEIAEAISFCIADKAAKINGRYRYNWLVLVDQAGFFRNVGDVAEAWPLVGNRALFDRVLILHGTRDECFFDSTNAGRLERR